MKMIFTKNTERHMSSVLGQKKCEQDEAQKKELQAVEAEEGNNAAYYWRENLGTTVV